LEGDVHLVRDILDKAVVDRQGREIGRADSVILTLGKGAPRVARIESGPAVLAARLWPTRTFTFDRIVNIDQRLRADAGHVLGEGEVRLDALIGREVLAGNNRRIGLLEEFRAEVRDGACQVTELVIGVAGLLERLGLGAKLILGWKRHGYVARWDQIDFKDPAHPRLTCSVDELQPIA